MVVLPTKCYVQGDARERALRSLRDQLHNTFGDLEVDFEVGVRHDEFVSVTVEGDDAAVARNLLREQWGEVTEHFEPGETYVGTLESWDDAGFVLDAGVDVRIPTAELGLGPGTASQIRERFGLVQHVPLEFVYRGGDVGDDDDGGDEGGEGDDDDGGDEGGEGDEGDDGDGGGAGDGGDDDDERPHRLSDAERDRLFEWRRGDGRVNVNSATRGEVRATVNRAGHARDIVTVERLGLLEQSIVCTPDTDPPGLLAAIGQYLPAELRCVVP